MPKVAVLMPVYNAGKYLSESIRSILSQSFTDFSFYIVDDGSTDNSLEIIASFNDPRIKILRKEKNSGVTDTLNFGLAHITEPLVTRMDADDIALPERLNEQYNFMMSDREKIICGTQVEYFGDQTNTSSLPLKDAELKTQLLFQNCFIHPSVMFRTALMKQGYPDKYPHLEDYAAWIGLRDKGKFGMLDKVLIKYRMEGQNISFRNYGNKLERVTPLYKQLLEELNIEPSGKNILLHFSLCGHICPGTGIEEIIDHANLIIEKNKIVRCYPEKELKELIIHKLNVYYFLIVKIRPRSAFVFWKKMKSITFKQFRYWLSATMNKKR